MAEQGDQNSKNYNADLGRVSGAVEALFRHDGWEIFMALFARKKKEIHERSDYETLEAFKGDRVAIEIVEGIIEEMKGFKEDAVVALLSTAGEEKPSRGIMLIEAMEGENREA